MKRNTLLAVICLLLLGPSLFAQTAVTTAVPIPEEARKHFVMGTTLFKDAKTAADFSQVESEFKQAADLAPQWPEARYNLALAKEAAGDYSGAMADMKLYQKFTLSRSEARTVQDKIYALEAKAEVAAKKQAEDQQASAADKQKRQIYLDKIGFLEGRWNCHEVFTAPSRATLTFDYKVDITVSGKTVTLTKETRNKPFARGTLHGDDYASIQWFAADDTNDQGLDGPVAPAQDTPITLQINRAGPRLTWQEPQILMDGSASGWTMQFGPRQYTLTK